MKLADLIAVALIDAEIPDSDRERIAQAVPPHGTLDALAAALARAGYEGPPSDRPRYYVVETEHHGNVITRAINEERAHAQVTACGVPEGEIFDGGISADIPPRLARAERATPLTWGFDLDRELDQDDGDPLVARWLADSSNGLVVCPKCGAGDLEVETVDDVERCFDCWRCGTEVREHYEIHVTRTWVNEGGDPE